MRRLMHLSTLLVSVASLLGILVGSAAAQSSDEVRYYHSDAIGTVRVITDDTGTVQARYDYLPFGERWPNSDPADPRMFAGKERDPDTGLDYFGARYYAGQTGRFTSVDPVYTWQENLVDPQRWNRYAYVRNNPQRYIDPDGRAIDVIADLVSIVYDLFDIGRSVARGQGVSGTQVGALGADVLGAVIPFATGGGIAVRAAAHADDIADAGRAVERTAIAAGPYVRPSGATTRASARLCRESPALTVAWSLGGR